jgi:alginate O-acetyltransferase complex protein AlgJ
VKNYPAKYFLFFLPFIGALCLELFILPIHQFTFRVWESLIVKRSFAILKGPFYPNMSVRKMEEGDLAYYTPCAIKKDVQWITDQYGYRRANTPDHRYPVVIIGDSNIAGSGLTQEELLSEVLQKRLGMVVYPLSPERINSIFDHILFKKLTPRIVILASVERGIPAGLSKLSQKRFEKSSSWSKLLSVIQLNSFLQHFGVLLDRTFKANMLNYLRARVNKAEPSLPEEIDTSKCPLFFSHGQSTNQEATMERYKLSIDKIKEYSDFFTSRGIRFIFLPLPNKETIHYEYLKTKKPEFLSRLIQKLQELNVEVIDTQKAFHEFYQETHIPLYQEDDTHWNALGVKITAELLAKQIKTTPASISR